MILAVVYLLCVGIVLAMTFWGQSDGALDLSTVYEKEVDFLYVFTSNSRSMLIGMVGGIATFGLMSTYLFFYNAVSLGMIANALVAGGMPGMALRMLPHGLIELAALVLAAAVPLAVDVYAFRQIKPVICGDVGLGAAIKRLLVFLLVNAAAMEAVLLVAGVVECAVSRL